MACTSSETAGRGPEAHIDRDKVVLPPNAAWREWHETPVFIWTAPLSTGTFGAEHRGRGGQPAPSPDHHTWMIPYTRLVELRTRPYPLEETVEAMMKLIGQSIRAIGASNVISISHLRITAVRQLSFRKRNG